MRDDVKTLFRELLSLYRKELTYLEQIRSREPDKHYYQKSGDPALLQEALDADRLVMDKIDVLEFEIAALKERILSLSGKENSFFEALLPSLRHDLARELVAVLREINQTLMELKAERESLIRGMEEKSANIKKDIDSLSYIIEHRKDLNH